MARPSMSNISPRKQGREFLGFLIFHLHALEKLFFFPRFYLFIWEREREREQAHAWVGGGAEGENLK